MRKQDMINEKVSRLDDTQTIINMCKTHIIASEKGLKTDMARESKRVDDKIDNLTKIELREQDLFGEEEQYKTFKEWAIANIMENKNRVDDSR